jgi:hypothetical protein
MRGQRRLGPRCKERGGRQSLHSLIEFLSVEQRSIWSRTIVCAGLRGHRYWRGQQKSRNERRKNEIKFTIFSDRGFKHAGDLFDWVSLRKLY